MWEVIWIFTTYIVSIIDYDDEDTNENKELIRFVTFCSLDRIDIQIAQVITPVQQTVVNHSVLFLQINSDLRISWSTRLNRSN